jgi:S1-C subfamily serine protease
MGKLLGHDIPAFAGLQSLIAGSRPENRTLFSVIDDPAKVEAALRLLQESSGGADEPATGIAFTIPILHVQGLAEDLRSGAD